MAMATPPEEPEKESLLSSMPGMKMIRSGGKPDRGENGTTFFKTVGMALFDLAAARLIYECSKESDIGTVLD